MYEKLKELIKEQLGTDNEINTETSLKDDLGADSLDAVELIMALEDEFDIEVTDEDAEKFETIGDIVNYLETVVK